MVSSLVSDKPAASQPSGLPVVIFNLVNSLLGAGMLSLPYAWQQTGFMMGFFVFVFVAMVSEYAIVSLITMADPLCRKGEIATVCYEQLAERILGIWGRRAVLFAQFLYAWGIGIAYLVAIANELTTGLVGVDVLDSPIPHSQRMLTLVVASALLFPVMCLRTVRGLRFASIFCFFCAIGLIGIVAYELQTDRDEICLMPYENSTLAAAADPSAAVGTIDKCTHEYHTFGKLSFFGVMGTFVFGLACQHTQFQIYRSLGSDASLPVWRKATGIAISLVVLVNIAAAMVTYNLFGESVQSDFFLSFGEGSKLPGVIIGRFVFGLMLMMSFPIQEFIARETLQVLIADWMAGRGGETARLLKDGDCEDQVADRRNRTSSVHSRRSIRSSAIDKVADDDKASAAGGAVREATSNLMHYSTTAILFGTCLTVALITDSLGAVLSLSGGIAGSMIAFILPGLCAWKVEQETGIVPLGGSKAGPILGMACTVFGVLVAIASCIFTFVKVE